MNVPPGQVVASGCLGAGGTFAGAETGWSPLPRGHSVTKVSDLGVARDGLGDRATTVQGTRRMIAWSRRSAKVVPAQDWSSRRRLSSPMTGGNSSGMAGGLVCAIGEA
ncbi:MAG: hypothetical protein EBT09_05565, partial [Actinobacteria bacterium]|nr:hypothetical protein [Actinomycetota bacterium]